MEVWIVGADDEEETAEIIAERLRSEGYEASHFGTLRVGDNILGSIEVALRSNTPVVLAATRAAMGDVRCQNVINAARAHANNVFVVRMHPQAALAALDADRVIADYSADGDLALERLVEALTAHYPLSPPSSQAATTLEPINLFDINFLDQVVVNAELRIDSIAQTNISYDPDNPRVLTRRLQTLGLMKDARLTLGGLLLFGANPQIVLPSAIVQCFAYDGVDVTDPVTARLQIRGNILQQIADGLDFVRNHSSRHETLRAESGASIVSRAYSEASVRELIANALVHRDYSKYGQRVHVNLYSDRLCVVSPGSWVHAGLLGPENVELDRLQPGSDARNPRLAAALSELGFVEAQGSGLPKMVKESQKTRARKPVGRESFSQVEVTIFPSIEHDPARETLSVEARRAWNDLSQGAGPLTPSLAESYVDRKLRAPSEHGELAEVEAITVLRGDSKPIAIVGTAYTGKTVLMQRLAYLSVDLGLTPILVSGRTYRSGDLRRWIATTHRSTDVSVDALAAALASSDSVVLLDALDEIAPESRAEFEAELRRFRELSSAKLIFASRPSALTRRVAEALAAQVYSLQPWTDVEVMQMLRTQSPDPVFGDLAVLSNQARRQLLGLAIIPLLGVRTSELAGSSLWEYLDYYVHIVLDREMARSQRMPPLHLLNEVHRQLASRLLEAPNTLAVFEPAALRSTVATLLSGIDQTDASILFSYIDSGSDPFLVRSEDGVAFAHGLIAEYFAADWLVRNQDGERLAASLVALVRNDWTTVASLALSAATERSPVGHKSSLLQAMERVGNTFDPGSLERLYEFLRQEGLEVTDTGLAPSIHERFPGESPADQDLEERFGAFILSQYRHAKEPLNLARLAEQSSVALGPGVRSSKWFGHGTFVRALKALRLPDANFTNYYVWDTSRHMRPTPKT